MRYRELDILRGLALCLMILYHLLFDLNFFTNITFPLNSLFWSIFQKITAGVFFLLVGICITISTHTRLRRFRYFLWRGLRVFALGLLITLITFFVLEDWYVRFGVLHFIGSSIVLAYPFRKMKSRAILFGVMALLIGSYFAKIISKTSLLLPFGIRTVSFHSVDYFPLFPWFGIILFGVFLGNSYYKNPTWRSRIPSLKGSVFEIFAFLGRNSLLIYLLHQPVLFGIILLLV